MLHIGLDFDGVLADSVPLLVEGLNLVTGSNYKREDIRHFDLYPHYCTEDQYPAVLNHFREHRHNPEKVPVYNQANKYLSALSPYNKLTIVSHRKSSENDLAWLSYYKFPYNGQVNYVTNKMDFLKSNPVDIYIEDCLYYAEEISKSTKLVLLMDALYNQTDTLPHNVIRVYTWSQAYTEILKYVS